MKRKVLSLALGLCMVFGLMVSANAAAPSATGTTTPTVSDATASDGTVIPAGDIKVSAVQDVASLPAEEAAVLTAATEAITSAASTAEFVQSAGIATAVERALVGTSVAVEDLAPAATFSVSSAGAAAEVIANGGSVELSFEVEGVSDGDVVVVMVFDGTSWSVVPAVVRNGKVVGTFTTLGTVVVMKADQAGPVARVTSPQTSGANLESVILVCGVVLSLAVLALCVKRSRMA